MNRFIAIKADAVPRNAIVIPFIDEEDASAVAKEMNAESTYHLTHAWAKGPAHKYIHDDGPSSWVVYDTQQQEAQSWRR